MNTYTKSISLIVASILFISCGSSNDNDNESTALNTIIAHAEGSGEVPKLQDYSDAGVVGLTTTEQLADMNEVVSNLTKEEVDTTEEIQALANDLGVVISIPTPTPTPVASAAEVQVLSKKVSISGYLSTCDDYIEQKGKDVNNNGVLDTDEITSSTEVHPQGEALTIDELKTKIANGDDVSNVNTCNITDMQSLFFDNTTFNKNIGAWNTAAVTSMEGMFTFASAFNQDIGSWDTSSVTNMNSMFSFASIFNQDISQWNVAKVQEHTSFSTDSALSSENSPF